MGPFSVPRTRPTTVIGNPLAIVRTRRHSPPVRPITAPALPLPASRPGFTALLRGFSRPTHYQQVHGLLLTTGLSHKNRFVTQLLLSLLSFGETCYARSLFDEMRKPRVFLWNTLIKGYVNACLPGDAIGLYQSMHRAGVRPDNFTFPFVLKACTALLEAWLGMVVHSLLIKSGLVFDPIVATELMVMYAKCEDPVSAERIFDGMSDDKDLVAWNALINAFAQNGQADKALKLFRRMDSDGFNPDSVTLVGAISSCAYLGCLEFGKKLHSRIQEEMLKANVFIKNALLDMYAKCGCMEEANKLFSEMRQRNVISWSTMIGGYAINGDSQRALSLFAQMQDEGVQPNHVTHLAVLSACGHAGLVCEGKDHFNSMRDPRIEHYAAMVDLLGRSGYLDEAYQFIRDMTIEPDAGVWGALLGACTIYHNTELGQLAADQLLRIAPEIPSYHVLISNIYAGCGRWDDVENVRQYMRGNDVKKIGGYSSMDLDGEVYVFHEGSHTQSKEIYKKLDELTTTLRGMGYTPVTSVVLHDVEVEEKETAVRTHSEKLAIAFSLIRSKRIETPVRIIKNLRICNDCHLFSKYASKALGREIIMRDKNRFHRFKDGGCSCRDFW